MELIVGWFMLIVMLGYVYCINVCYENMYKIEFDVKFRSVEVWDIIKSYFECEFGIMKYDKERCISLIMILLEKIKYLVKILGFFCYKIVVVVVIGE